MPASMIDPYAVTTITWEAKSGQDVNNDPTFSAAVTVKAKVVNKEKQFKSTQTGDKKISTTQIYFNPQWDINVEDRITIDSVKYSVGFRANRNMFTVADHKEAMLVVIG